MILKKEATSFLQRVRYLEIHLYNTQSSIHSDVQTSVCVQHLVVIVLFVEMHHEEFCLQEKNWRAQKMNFKNSFI